MSPKGARDNPGYDMIFIEWLCLEDPRAEFSSEKPRLPGQQRPGLGISPEVVELVVIMAERLGKDGLINVPRYYHTALMAERGGFLFIEPETQGRMEALERDLAEQSMARASWAAELGVVTDKERNEPFLWTGEEQVFAISERTKQYFESKDYERRRRQAAEASHFTVDWEAYMRQWQGRKIDASQV